ncbi:MAG: NAD(P)-dependent oxidoreductase [Eubacterium sp.]|nr:NAD(P)-dependent oxidoreductase [Eubacterium sp.]
MKIVITGATGFIGLHLINEWLKDDAEIYSVIRPNSKNKQLIPTMPQVHLVECEMDDYDHLQDLIKEADYFYHFAWEGARAPYRDNEDIQRKNYECSVKAIHSAYRMGCSFFLGSGSQAEYGITTGIVDEEYPCNPVNAYGKEKLHAYNELSKLAKQFGIRFVWTRIFSIYGPHDYPGTLIMSALDKMKKNEPIKMTAGTQLWDYLYVEDAARAMKQFALQSCEDGVYIIAFGDYHPLNQYISTMKEVMGSNSELRFGVIPYGPAGPVNLTPNPAKTMITLGWKAEIRFEDGIRKMLLLN